MNKINVDKNYLDMMLFNFNYAIKNNTNSIYVGYMISEEGKKEFWVERTNWETLINILIDEASNLEEYEFALDFKNIKEKI